MPKNLVNTSVEQFLNNEYASQALSLHNTRIIDSNKYQKRRICVCIQYE